MKTPNRIKAAIAVGSVLLIGLGAYYKFTNRSGDQVGPGTNGPENVAAAAPSKDVPPRVVEPPPPEPVAAAPMNPRPRRGKPPPMDPQAREALALAGKDLGATMYWIGAINNPDLPSEERKDLIEDLNEDGFPDRRNITRDDLPLIESRIALIEKLLPEAMDKVNEEAFREALKDLRNMVERLSR